MNKVRMISIILILAMTLSFAFVSPALATTYTMTSLGALGSNFSAATSINESGQVVGYADTAVYPGQHAFLWEGGGMNDLGTLGGTNSIATEINESGQVIGASDLTGNTGRHAFLWEGGGMIDLGSLGGSHSIPNGINESGQVVGYAIRDTGQGRAFLWENGVMTDLGTLGGNHSYASGINDSGQVVGYAYTAGNAAQHAFLWEGGLMVDLGTLGGNSSYGTAVNEIGQVVGASDTTGNTEQHAFLWENGVMADLGTLGGSYSYAIAVNEAGQVIGYSFTSGNAELHGFLWEGGVMSDLGTLGGGSTRPYAINDAGQVVGYSFTSAGESHAFLWENGVMTDLGTLGGSYSYATAINETGQVVGQARTGGSAYFAFITIPMVVNQPPFASAGGPYQGNEGSAITMSGAGASDPDPDTITYNWSVDSALCNFDDVSLLNPNLTCTDNGDFTATLEVSDGINPPIASQAAVTVNNVAPSVDTPFVLPEPSTEGQPVAASATFGDLGSNDGPFICSVNYGDGSGDLPGTIIGDTCMGPAHIYLTFGSYSVTVTLTDKDSDTGSNSTSHAVIFNWTGFFQPVDNLPTVNSVKAGQAIPVKFSLNGDQGLNIFAAGFPKSEQITCNSNVLVDGIEETVTPGASSLTYDLGSDQYQYVWKTQKSWANTCRQLVLKFVDGTTQRANFKFK